MKRECLQWIILFNNSGPTAWTWKLWKIVNLSVIIIQGWAFTSRAAIFFFFFLIVYTVRKNETRIKTCQPSWRAELLGLLVFANWKLIRQPFFFCPQEVSASSRRRAKRPVRFKVELVFWSASKWKNKVASVLNKLYAGSQGLWRVFRDPHPRLVLAFAKENSRSFPIPAFLALVMLALSFCVFTHLQFGQ